MEDIRKYISGRISDNKRKRKTGEEDRKRAAGKKVVNDIDCSSSDILNQVWFITKETVKSPPEKKFIYRFSGLMGQSSCCEQTLWTDILAFNNNQAECQKTRLHHYIAGIIYLSYSFQQPLSVHDRFQEQHNDYIESRYGNKSAASDVKYDDRKVFQFQFQLSDIILSPQQLSILRSGIRNLVVYGEAGSGKSSLLLALALEKCGKQVSSPEHVYYFTPDRKSSFHEDLETFGQKYCQERYFHVTYLSKFKDIIKNTLSKATLLIDEVYHNDFGEVLTYAHSPVFLNTWVACVIGGQENVPDDRRYVGGFKTRYLTVLYRSSAHISGLSTYILNKKILKELGASSAVLFKCFTSGNKKSFQLKRVWPSNLDPQHVMHEMVRFFFVFFPFIC